MRYVRYAEFTHQGVLGCTRLPCTCGGILRSPPDCGCDGSGKLAKGGVPWYYPQMRAYRQRIMMEELRAGGVFLGGGPIDLDKYETLYFVFIGADYEGDIVFPHAEFFVNSDSVAAAHLGLGDDPSPWWFECVERVQGDHPHLTYTKWRRS